VEKASLRDFSQVWLQDEKILIEATRRFKRVLSDEKTGAIYFNR
jgi:hypothetical protein